MTLSPLEITLLVAVCVVPAAAVLLPILASRDQRYRRLVRRARLVGVDQLEPGMLVRIRGVAAPATDVLRAPITGRRCLWYRVEITEVAPMVMEGDLSVIETEKAVDLELRDERGRAVVRASPIEVGLEPGRNMRAGDFRDAPRAFRTFLAKHGEPFRDPGGFERLFRYREQVLLEGDEVEVIGRVERERDPSAAGALAGYRSWPQRLVVRAPKGLAVQVREPSQ